MIGIPGSGKSTIARELAKLMHGKCYLEPNNNDLPDFVKHRDTYGTFSTITWFRNERVKQLMTAVKNNDQLSVIDTYFDKLMYLCRNSKGLNWMVSKNDCYWEACAAMWKADYFALPQADIACELEITNDLWLQFIDRRKAFF